ncbi:MAG: ABC transporter permease [Pseudomonadota bacterium]
MILPAMVESTQDAHRSAGVAAPTQRRPRWAMARSLAALMLREMTTTYGRSLGGYIWAILEPVAGLALITFILSIVFTAPPIGTSFALFYASGFLAFMLYLNVSTKVSQTIRYSKALLFYPRVRYIDALVARFALNMITEMVVAALVLGAILSVLVDQVHLDVTAFVLAIAMGGALALGIGTLNCYLMARFDLWERAWGIFSRPLFIVSSIFFLYETVPHPWRDALWWNPLVHVIGQMRRALYPTYEGQFVSPAYVFGIALACMALGLAALNRSYRDLINN